MVFVNNIHIMSFIVIGIIGAFMGFFSGWCNERLPEYKKVFTKEIFMEYKTRLKPNYLLMAIGAVLYILLLYRFGIHNDFMANLPLIQYLILVPILLSVFCIDYRHTIIPNRLNLTIFEVGFVCTFVYGVYNFKLAEDAILGMLVGGGIFLLISGLGRLIAGKEAMGFGDVKLMGALGLFFGLNNTIVITVLAFLIGAIISIGVMIVKRSTNQYIPFGPFIVLGAFITIFVPSQLLISFLLKIFTLGLA